jgi:2-polyprenyl-3-methyl-5-hydroxy-6-metoxy-1,4-benzoquinol methylase
VPDVSAWDDRAAWYVEMVRDERRGFNHLAADVAARLVGDVTDRDVLDIGTGEGWFARRLATAGVRVVAAEPTAALLAEARRSEAETPLGIRFVPDAAEDLRHVAAASVDVAIALLVLHHVESLSTALTEVVRVLRPAGRFVTVVPHPWCNHPGWRLVDGRLRVGDYAVERFWRTDESDSIRGIGWHHRTVATWITAIARAGFVVQSVEEPVGHDDRRADGGGPWRTIPRFLAIASRRP